MTGRELTPLVADHPLDGERLWFAIRQAGGASGGMTGDSEMIVMIEPTFKLRQANGENLIARLAASAAGALPPSQPARPKPPALRRRSTTPKPTPATWLCFGL